MIERNIRGNIIRHVVGGLIAVIAVITASHIWRLPQAHGSLAVLAVYAASIILLIIGAFIVFRRVVRRSYDRNHRLTPFPSFLQLLIWGLFFAFPYIYNPINWAWSQSHTSQVIPIIRIIGWACVWLGLASLLGAFAWLGLPRSFGQKGKNLVSSGPYRVTRNPQMMGGTLLIIGYVVLWPSWFALGWLILFAVMMQMMVLTEEEHLRRIYGEDYEEYCKGVPRYLGFLRKS